MNLLERERIYARVKAKIEALRSPGTASSAMCLHHAVLTAREIHACGVRAVLQAGTAEWAMRRPEQDDEVSPTHFGYVWSPHEFDWSRLHAQ